MGFKQSYKGIFQFESQAHLERAMAENQAEAIGADAMGLQDSYHAEGVMLIDIDLNGDENDWDEMSVAVATLAMHASKGFLHAIAHRPEGQETEYYAASGDDAPVLEDDYFPFLEGAEYSYKAQNLESDSVSWKVEKIVEHGTDFYFFRNQESGDVHHNAYSDGTYFHKDGTLVSTVYASNPKELDELDLSDSYSWQTIYNNRGQAGSEINAIWNQNNHFSIYTQEEFENVELPAGKFNHCLKIRVEHCVVEKSVMTHDVYYQYFAKGIGLVKWEKDGASLELSSYKF